MNQPDIKISVEINYIIDQSDPADKRYVFSYHITIKNNSSTAVQLLRRRWLITDANNNIQEVQGTGVVGQQPVLEPEESFCYTSATIIETPIGYMQGNYYLITNDGIEFDTKIPVFRLAIPNAIH